MKINTIVYLKGFGIDYTSKVNREFAINKLSNIFNIVKTHLNEMIKQ